MREYLEALRATKPRRGRKRTVESITARLDRIEREMRDASPLFELQLVQERRDLGAEIEVLRERVDIAPIEDEFVKVAASYSSSKGITYASWRDVGVDAAVLKRAGISRSTQR